MNARSHPTAPRRSPTALSASAVLGLLVILALLFGVTGAAGQELGVEPNGTPAAPQDSPQPREDDRSAGLDLSAGDQVEATPEPGMPEDASITLNPAVTYQIISGWEATAQIGEVEFKNYVNQWKNTVADLAVNDLGITRLRVEIRGGAENPTDWFTQYLNGQIDVGTWKAHRYEIINDNSNVNSINWSGFQFAEIDHIIDNVVLPIKQRLEAQGKHLYINVNYVDFDASGFEHKSNPAEYGEFVLAAYQHLQSKYGWVPDAWEVILEADNGGAQWSGAQIGSASQSAVTRLLNGGFTPNLIIPSTMILSNATGYFNAAIGAAPSILPYVSEISYHRYQGVSDANIQAIANLAVQNGIDAAMLEHIGSGYQDLHKDLTLGRNSSWQQFTLAYPVTSDDGSAYYMIQNPTSNPSVVMGSRTKFLRQYFRYIKPGALRISASTSNSNVNPVAFINPDGGYVVVINNGVANNPTSISGLPAGTYSVRYTTSSQYDYGLPDVVLGSGQALTVQMPASGVITIYRKSGGTGPTPTPTRTPTPVITRTPFPEDSPRLYIPGIRRKR